MDRREIESSAGGRGRRGVGPSRARRLLLALAGTALLSAPGCSSFPWSSGSDGGAAPDADVSPAFPRELAAVTIESDKAGSDQRAGSAHIEAHNAFEQGFLDRGYRVVASTSDLQSVLGRLVGSYENAAFDVKDKPDYGRLRNAALILRFAISNFETSDRMNAGIFSLQGMENTSASVTAKLITIEGGEVVWTRTVSANELGSSAQRAGFLKAIVERLMRSVPSRGPSSRRAVAGPAPSGATDPMVASDHRAPSSPAMLAFGGRRAALDAFLAEFARRREADLGRPRGALAPEALTADRLAASLGEGGAMLLFRRVSRMGERAVDHHSYLAELIRFDGAAVARRTLAAAPIDAATRDWLDGLDADPRASGPARQLADLLLGPFRDDLAGITALTLAPDGPLLGAPLDVLPWDDGLIGESFAVDVVADPRDWIPAGDAPLNPPRLLVVGGVDYGALPPAERIPAARGASLRLPPLPQTMVEVDFVKERFRKRFGAPAAIRELAGRMATRSRVLLDIESFRCIHFATHAVADDARPHAELWDVPRICLSGANECPRDSHPSPGWLTAGDLRDRDLSRCDLVVLAACGGHRGVPRADDGLHSLLGAFRMAGARTIVASRWSVGDAATRRLVERFYVLLWEEGLPPSRALWRARMDLRHRVRPDGRPALAVADWAGWVISGVRR